MAATKKTKALKQEYLQRMADDLIRAADRMGFIVRIDTIFDPDRPLAMGNVKMQADIRPRRGNY